MTLQECYAAMGADYNGVLGRLRSERLVQKFVLKFLADGSYDLLCRSMQEGNHDEAFRAAHTIKGMCQNLSFTTLGHSSGELTEALRNDGTIASAAALFAQVQADYERTSSAIRDFQAGLS